MKLTTKLKCKYCKSSFTRKFSLNRHVIRKHSGQSITYYCNLCNESFDILSDFEEHKKFKHQPSEDFKRYKSALHGSVEIYRKILPLKESTFDEGFDKKTCDQIFDLVNYKLLYHPSYSIYFIFCGEFKLFDNNTLSNTDIDLEQYPFKSPKGIVTYKNNRGNRNSINKLRSYLSLNIDDFMQNGSGYILHDVLYLDVQFVRLNAL